MSARSRSAKRHARQLRRRLHLEPLEQRLLLAADAEGDSLTSALSLSLTRGAIYQHQATIGDGDYPTGDVDLYAVSLQAGQHLSVAAEAMSLDEGGSLSTLDTYLRLFDSSGNELASNDSGGNPYTDVSSSDAALSFVVSTSGTYCVGVSAFDNTTYDPATAGSGSTSNGINTETGDYRLELLLSDNTILNAPPGLTISTPGANEADLFWSAVSGVPATLSSEVSISPAGGHLSPPSTPEVRHMMI